MISVRHGAWAVVLVSGCFHPSYSHTACSSQEECPGALTCIAGFCEAAATDDAATVDGLVIPSLDAAPDAPAGCVSVSYLALNELICPVAPADSIVVAASTSIDTDAGTSTPAGLTCAPLTPTSASACVLAASSITIAASTILAAHGTKPLVVFGRAIDIEGTIDVASHINGQQGAASDAPGCNTGVRSAGDGGGQGGTFNGASGGKGGDGIGTEPVQTGGGINPSIGIATLRGGCPGGPSGTTSAAIGGHGGGAVWLAIDGGGMLTLGGAAIINASGASGAGGVVGVSDRGGFGGGSGGLILVTAPTVMLSATAQVFADGGGGGGGAGHTPGSAGSDPTAAGIGGRGGAAGLSSTNGDSAGAGGLGAPAVADQRNGVTATAVRGGGGPVVTDGGGGGGGGDGAIWIAAQTIGTATISPPPLLLNR